MKRLIISICFLPILSFVISFIAIGSEGIKFKGERASYGYGNFPIEVTINDKGFYPTNTVPKFIPWEGIDEWQSSKAGGVGFYFYKNKEDQLKKEKDKRDYFLFLIPYGDDQIKVINLFRKYIPKKKKPE